VVDQNNKSSDVTDLRSIMIESETTDKIRNVKM